jgi:glucuronate isomerase
VADHRQVVQEALREVKVIDPHCHLRPERPCADNLADILLYHHVWIELVSSGMPQHEVTRKGLPQELGDPEIAPFERVRRALKYVDPIWSTTSGLYLRWILQDLYGVQELNDRNLTEVYDIVQQKADDERWQDELFAERCGIERSITVESDAPSGRILVGREHVLQNILDGKRSSAEMLASMERSYGRAIDDAQDYRQYVTQLAESLPSQRPVFVNVWSLPSLNEEFSAGEQVNRTLQKVKKERKLTPAEAGGFGYFGLTAMLDALEGTDLRVVQLFTGAEVLLPHRSITQWSGRYCGAIARLAGRYGDFRFNLSSASDAFTQDLAILAKHVPNVSLGAYWWHTLYPFYIKKSLECRLDAVPANKIIAFFSDAYRAEWCYPKLKMVKQILEEILLERIEKGWYTLDMAVDIISKLFYENPKAIYGV